MSNFESILAASVALLLGIPFLMDKVFRPRYEEKFEKFRQESKDKFLGTFEEASQKLKQNMDEISPETVGIMESLFENWSLVKKNENVLQSLFSARRYLFLGWMISVVLSLMSLSYADFFLMSNFNVGQLTEAVFGLMAAFSTFYVMALFSLDNKLIKFSRNVENQDIRSSTGTLDLSSSFTEMWGRGAELKVENSLKKSSIPYEIGRFTLKGERVMFDYAIPSTKNPSFVIEVKPRLMSQALLNDLSYRLLKLRTAFPNVKGILVLKISATSTKALETAKNTWLFLDFKEVDKLDKIIKL